MTPESELRAKLRKIEALFAGAKTDGERAAAGAAIERVKARLGQAAATEREAEMRFKLPDPWARKVFVALCRRYGLRPYRHPRMQRQTVLVRVPPSFVDSTLWPEFVEIERVLRAFLEEITVRVIAEEISGATQEADVVPDPAGTAR